MSGLCTRTCEFHDPSVTADGAASKTGLEFLRDVASGKVPAPPIQATLGFSLIEVQDGFARYELALGLHLFGAMNAIDGGVTAALLESAMNAAATTTVDALTAATVVALTVHATRAITPRTSKVVAEGWVVHRGSRLVTVEGRVHDVDGRLLAHGSASCSLAPRAAV